MLDLGRWQAVLIALLERQAEFQSLLCWISVVGGRPLSRPDGDRLSVSILVVLDLGRWPRSWRWPEHRPLVSILVVLDLGRWPGMTLAQCSQVDCSFNPCCVGSRSLAGGAVRSGSAHGQVSILVVLDLGRWPPFAPTARSAASRFNPCCVGSRSLAIDGPRRLDGLEVSILVVLDLGRWRSVADGTRMLIAMGFNPCCVGSRSLATASMARSAIAASSFNPCCVGSRSLARVEPRFGSMSSGFNPCCVGSRSLAIGTRSGAPRDPRFQSLLCWISVVGDACRLGLLERRSMFQSLLSWISVVGTHGRWPHDVERDQCFNPCFVGSRSLARGRWSETSRDQMVSILVFLDLGRWPAVPRV